MWILQSSEGAAPAVTFRVSPCTTRTIGRAPIADLILDAPLVSRVHCRLEASEETLEVVDLESTNGVVVNGERVSRRLLIPGDRLEIGRVELTVARSVST
jgi:pSer/pThr/pTyr-binding forkhead associated (FHA) protein